jgi:hypothetical protein
MAVAYPTAIDTLLMAAYCLGQEVVAGLHGQHGIKTAGPSTFGTGGLVAEGQKRPPAVAPAMDRVPKVAKERAALLPSRTASATLPSKQAEAASKGFRSIFKVVRIAKRLMGGGQGVGRHRSGAALARWFTRPERP